MATPRVSDTPEVEEHYLAQYAIVGAVATASRDLWPLLDPTDIAGTYPTVNRGLTALVDRFSRAAVSVSADHYADLRSQHVRGPYSVPVIDVLADGTIRARLAAAEVAALDQVEQIPDELWLGEITAKLIYSSRSIAQGLVADASSDEIFAAMNADPEAQGWARITRPGACYFCRMLASRGPVYITRETASFRAHKPKDGRGGICRCTVEPVFSRRYEMTAQARADEATWKRVTDGLSGADAVDAFRREVEGRADGPRRSRRRLRAGRKQESDKRPRFDQLTVAQLQHHLAVIEPLKDSDWRTEQMDRLRKRIAELGA